MSENKNLRIAMVYPEVFDLARFNEKRKEFPPFGVMYLSSMMENAGHSVDVYPISKDNFKLNLSSYDAVGFSIPSSATLGTIKKSCETSSYKPNALKMAGGVHANLYPEQTLTELHVDIVGVGECENTILEILENIVERNFESINGVCFKNCSNKITRTPPRHISKDIDWLPLPARHLLPVGDIVMDNRLSNTSIKMAHVMFTRGCPFPCRFCAVAQSKIQFRSGASARKELIHLKEEYGVEGYAIVDDNFIVNKQKVYDIARATEDLGLKWSGLSRVDTVDRDLLMAMKKSGCIELKFGMESGSPSLLKAMKKDTSPEQILYAAKTAHSIGIKVKMFIVHGYPGENLETTRETMQLLNKLAPYTDRVSLFRFTPLPGTYVYNNPAEFNLRGTDKDPDWDGNWDKYHIYHNEHHWWGSEKQFLEMNVAHSEISDHIDALWPETNIAPTAK